MVVDISDMDTLVRGYVITTLKNKFPLIDTSDNSPFDDMFIKPMIELVKPLIVQLNRLELKMNLDNASLMTEDELDELGEGNYLIPRHAGIPASSSLTLSFSNLNLDDATFSLKIPSGSLFETPAGIQFQTEIEINVSVTDLKKGYNKSKMAYEIDIPVGAIDIGVISNVEAGEISVCVNEFSNSLVSVTNKAPVQDGRDKEDNENYADRIRQFYISRQLGTKPGYRSFITESFPEIVDMYIAGKDDPYMQRDLLDVINPITHLPTPVHVGGKIDIYIKGFLLSILTSSITINSNLIILPIKYTDLFDQGNINGNFEVFNLTDQSKLPVILSATQVPEESYGGTYAGNVQIVLKNTANVSFDPNSVSDMKISYTYLDGDMLKTTNELYFSIGISQSELASPVKGVNSLSLSDTGDLTSISNYYTLIQTGTVGTTDEESVIVIKNIDTIAPNGSVMTVQHTVNDTLRQMDEIFNQEEFRIITTDLVCREATPVPVNVQFRTKLSSSVSMSDNIKSLIQASIISFFNTYELGSSIEESDIIGWIYNDESIKDSIQYIALPFDVFYIPQNAMEDIPTDPLLRQATDGVLPIQAIQYPSLNVAKFNVGLI